MTPNDPNPFDAETIEDLFEPTVEVPAALLLTAGCGCCGGGFQRARGRRAAWCC